jgi:transcriptional regulator with XRE-family HTH domain
MATSKKRRPMNPKIAFKMSLSELREALGKKQRDVSDAAKMTQSQLSAFERRDNHETKVLRRYVESLGGKLVLIAVFGEDQRVQLENV